MSSYKANTDRDDAIETLDQMLELQLDEGEKPNKSLWNVDDDNPNNNDDNLSVPLDEMFHQLLIQVAKNENENDRRCCCCFYNSKTKFYQWM